MNLKIRRLTILQAGKLFAVMYAFISVIILPVFLVMLLLKPTDSIGLLLMMIAYPILGFIAGIIGAALYNLAARFVGGLEITVDTTALTPSNLADVS